MGIIVPECSTDFGITLADAYIKISKSNQMITVSEDDNQNICISAHYMVYANKEARDNNYSVISMKTIQTSVEKQNLGNIFTHIYDALKQQFPGSIDEL